MQLWISDSDELNNLHSTSYLCLQQCMFLVGLVLVINEFLTVNPRMSFVVMYGRNWIYFVFFLALMSCLQRTLVTHVVLCLFPNMGFLRANFDYACYSE